MPLLVSCLKSSPEYVLYCTMRRIKTGFELDVKGCQRDLPDIQRLVAHGKQSGSNLRRCVKLEIYSSQRLEFGK